MFQNLFPVGFADELLSCGELEIYQATYKKLAFTVKEAEEKEANKKMHIPEGNLFSQIVIKCIINNSST